MKRPRPNGPEPQPDLSFIVSSYNRPHLLPVALWSLASQTHRNIEILVTDNAPTLSFSRQHRTTVSQVRSLLPSTQYVHTAHKLKVSDCYHSAEWGARHVNGRFLCFPCDDCYYAPQFAQRMLGAAYRHGWDFVECGSVCGPEMTGVDAYGVWVGRTIKTAFIIRRELFRELGFYGKHPGPQEGMPSAADQYLGRQVKSNGTSWGRLNDVMVFHN